MKSLHRILIAAPLALLGLTSAFAEHGKVDSKFGSPAHSVAFDRQIEVGPNTRWANVVKNETVKFVVTNGDGSQDSFIWRFDTLGTPAIDLRSLAPSSLSGTPAIKVYVSKDPRESA
jgi:hypothetical protein